MSLKIDEYLNSIGVFPSASSQNTGTASETSNAQSELRDSYTASETDSGAALPCDNYNDILKIIQKAKAESPDIDTSAESTNQSVSGVPSDKSDSSEEENETTKEIVTINGVTYLETTAVINGIKIVTRTTISGEKIPDIDQIGGPNNTTIPSNPSNS